ncbi:signal peptidase I [Myxococcota bacterium]|nr:signal peptidase I [Myxococcota bacterium]MBU1432617.1 signal peptidase I [Myxococcota bacterium]MBU1899520.1 signal peptidase I [Myxococcota bacterium]
MKRRRRRPSIKAIRGRLKSVSTSPKRRWGGRVIKIGLTFALISLLAARLFFYELVQARGEAMAPALFTGDVLLLERGGGVALGDVILIEHQGRSALRRILAGPGVQLGSLNGGLTRDGVPLHLSEAQAHSDEASGPRRPQRRRLECIDAQRCHEILGDYIGGGHSWQLEIPDIEVPPGHLFAFCDNRRACPLDEFSGVIPLEWITGRIEGVVWRRGTEESEDEGLGLWPISSQPREPGPTGR